jgi:hypothetical protein
MTLRTPDYTDASPQVQREGLRLLKLLAGEHYYEPVGDES